MNVLCQTIAVVFQKNGHLDAFNVAEVDEIMLPFCDVANIYDWLICCTSIPFSYQSGWCSCLIDNDD